MKRLFDLISALCGLMLFAPLMIGIAVVIKVSSKGPVIYTQQRTGHHEKVFYIYKFCTMVNKADTLGTSVTTWLDPRITPIGRILRTTKLDELPQLFNVLKGDMSLVGPRPDVPEITQKYTTQMKDIFSIRPGITSLATLHFRHEEEILAKVPNPDQFYDEVVVPLKVELAMEHARKNSCFFDLSILLQTVWVLIPLSKIWQIKEHELVKSFRETYLGNVQK